MPPFLAFLFGAGLVSWLFRRDFRGPSKVTAALWIPFIWFFINCSRAVAQWLELAGGGGAYGGGASYEAGTPADAVANSILLLAGLVILKRRQVRLGEVIRHNRWLALFFIFCLLAVFWSDYPFVSFKRWIKILGNPIMALVLLSEADPEAAMTRLMKWSAYVFVPFSIVFIKYFPGWGRGFDVWSGLPSNTGVTTNKNILGCVCFILGYFFIWQLLKVWPRRKEPGGWREAGLCLGFLGGIGWLLHMAHSSTSLASLGVGVAVMLVLGWRVFNSRNLGGLIISGVVVFVLANWTLGIVDWAIAALGRDPTLTDRTKIWHEVLKFDINPIFGTGFEGFWLGERRARLAEIFFWAPNQAHNGYLETYLNLGLVGLGLMLTLIIVAYRKAIQLMDSNLALARFRLGYLTAFVLYNWTEAAFKGLHPVWFVFFIVLMEYPARVDNHAPAEDMIT
ncbi:MAG: O-antigen ligase family protein [Verrucomicrobiae bacterium]|nr:O-antigen ligase family protein [Verrucomicrobiae bacterium]